MISVSMGTFFWLSTIFFYVKYTIDLPLYVDVLFLIVITVFMYFININIMQTKCSSANGVFAATFFPWICMFGLMMASLYFFPEWKTPFSNTFGYMIARLAGGSKTFLDVLLPGQETSLEYIYNDPSPLINTFTLLISGDGSL